jgi:hypothetical protein
MDRSANALAHNSRIDSDNIPSGVCDCNADNCLRVLRVTNPPERLAESQEFCGDFTKNVVADVSEVKAYLTSSCKADVVSRIALLVDIFQPMNERIVAPGPREAPLKLLS